MTFSMRDSYRHCNQETNRYAGADRNSRLPIMFILEKTRILKCSECWWVVQLLRVDVGYLDCEPPTIVS